MTASGFGGVGDEAASFHAVVSRRAASGISPRSLSRLVEAGLVTRDAPGVIGAGWAPDTWHRRLAAATLTGGGRGIVSHRSAARLHGLDGFTNCDALELTVPRGTRIRIAGVAVHVNRIEQADLHPKKIDGMRCTSLARTLIDLASLEPYDEFERALDDFQRRGLSLGWLVQEAQRLRRPGQRATGIVLREVERRQATGTVRGSWFERLIEAALSSARVPALIPQYEIRTAGGDLVARVDFAIPSVRLAIEAHSRAFHSGANRQRVDERRENLAMAEGWEFLYLGWADHATPEDACRLLESIVARRARDLGVDPFAGTAA